MSDRIIVMFTGEIMGELEGENADILQIGEMMMGQKLETTTERNS